MSDHLEEIEYCLALLTSEQLQIPAAHAERYLAARSWLLREYQHHAAQRKITEGDFGKHQEGKEGGETPETGGRHRPQEGGEV